MNNKEKIPVILKKSILVLVLLFVAWDLFAMHSLMTKFSDIILSGMKPGMVYSIKKEKNIPYVIINKASVRRNVEVIVRKPIPSQLRDNYEPIPDVSWITIYPSRFLLEPGEEMGCDIIIAIPQDEKYENRHFQAMITSLSIGEPGAGSGVGINLSISNRLRFSTGPRPEKALEEYRRKVFEVLKLEMAPMSLFIKENISMGEKVKLDGIKFPTVQVVNRSRENYRVEFHLAGKPSKYGLTKDYEPMPKEIKVKFKKKKKKFKKRSISDVVMEIKIPDREEFYGKSYAFVVVGNVFGFDIPIELFARVYFKTEEKVKSEELK